METYRVTWEKPGKVKKVREKQLCRLAREAEKVRSQDFLKEDGKMGKIVMESGMDGP